MKSILLFSSQNCLLCKKIFIECCFHLTDFADKLRNQVVQAKDDIDLRIECLKTELDVLRESYFKELDEQENLMLNFARIDTAKRAKLDTPNENISGLEQRLKNLKQIQDLFDYSLQITTSENLCLQWRDDKNSAIRINYETNIHDDNPNSKWKFITETENPNSLESKKRIKVSSSLKKAVYLQDDLIACTDLSNKITIIDIVTCNEIVKISNEVIPTSILFAPSKWLITAESTTLHIRNLETIETNRVTTKFEVKQLKSLGSKNIACSLKNVFLVSDKGQLHIYDMQRLKMIHTPEGKCSNENIKTIVFERCGKNRFLFKDNYTESIQVFDFNKKI